MADMNDILSGGPYVPADAQGPLMPGDYTDSQAQAQPQTQPQVQPQSSPDVDAQAQAPQQPSQQTAQPQTASAAPKSKWEAILTGALVGLAGAGRARNFAEGLAGGAQSSIAYNQQQNENAVQQQQLTQQQQRLQMEQQQSTDAHASAQQQMAMAQVQMHVLQAQYATMPKNVQDIMDRADMQAGSALDAAGEQRVGDSLSKNDAIEMIMAHRNADPNSALQYVMHQTPDGTFNVWRISDPNKLNDQPVDVTIGYNADSGKPITKRYDANSISVAQRLNIESNALANYTNQQNDLSEYKKKNAIQVGGEIAVAKAKQQMDSSPVYAVDGNGQTVLTTKAAAINGGMSAIRPVKEADVSRDQHDIKVLSDIQVKANNVQQAASAMDQKSWAQAGIAAKYLADNPNTTINTLFKSSVLKDASPQTKAYVIAVNSLRESSMGLQKVLTGSARSNETQLAALQNTLPGVEPDSGTVKQKLGAFTQNLGLLAQGLPKGTGVELSGFNGGQPQPAQQQQFQKYSSDGKWAWNGSQWVGTGR